MALVEAQRAGRMDPAQIVVMVCNRPGAAVIERARGLGVEALVLPDEDYDSREAFEAELIEALRDRGVDMIVLAGFMRILSPKFLEAFPRIINVHPALLPAFPGKDGIGDALAYGVHVTGVTVHYVDAGIDTGPIIMQEAVEITPGEIRETLAPRIHAVEHRLLPRAVQLEAGGRLRVKGRRVVLFDPEETL